MEVFKKSRNEKQQEVSRARTEFKEKEKYEELVKL